MKKAAMAVIGHIVETASIEGADRIQQAVVECGASGKWTGVVGKDMAVGDTVTQCAGSLGVQPEVESADAVAVLSAKIPARVNKIPNSPAIRHLESSTESPVICRPSVESER